MSFADLKFRLVGEVPGIPMPLAGTLINEALGRIYDSQLWSFQIGESNWLTPGLLFSSGTQSAGTITATVASDQIVGDATAAALWAAYSGLPFLTECQLRSPTRSLYNIVAFDGAATLTLDRPWMEPGGTGLAYMIYQAYFPAPVADFKRFFAVRDTTNAAPLSYWTYSQRDLAMLDPQRTNFNNPAYVVPYETDKRVGSATLGYLLLELWPQPLGILPYTFSYLRRGPLLSANTDTVPTPLTEELLMWRAKEVAYQWKESQKGDGMQRGSGADWRFLAESAKREFDNEHKVIRDLDRDLYDLYFDRYVRNTSLGWAGAPFATITGSLNVGRM